MQIGLFTREGRYLVGRIGSLVLSWDRHEGGKLTVAYLINGDPVQIGTLTMSLQLEEVELCSDADLDPRLIPGEAGPHRLALRAVPRLHDADGVHLGDAMQETWAWADGSVYLNAMMRVVSRARGGRLIGAGATFTFADGWQPAAGDGIRLVHDSGLHAAVVWHGNGGVWAHPADDPASTDARSVWGPPERRGGAGLYRNWGPYFEQWGGVGGWASVRLEDGPVLRAAWEEGAPREREVIEAFKGLMALISAGDEESLARKVDAFERPLVPSVAGGRVVARVPMEGTTMIDKTEGRVRLTYPADPAGREARLLVRGVASRHVVQTSGDAATTAFPVAYGGVADDPNGPNLLRPDDRHGPVLTDPQLRPNELLTTVALQPDRPVEFELRSEPGLWLASQRYDERQNLLLFSTAHPGDSLGALSLRDLPRNIGSARPQFQLCACWLDNHLYLESEGDTIPAGTTWEVDLTIVLAPPMNLDEDMEDLGRQALEKGEMPW